MALAAIAGAILLVLVQRPPRTDVEARDRLAGRRPAPAELNLVLVTLDTLRADRLGCYGFTGVGTPNIDALAAEGVLFEQATATVPLTFPSHASIFTGLTPPRHGVRDNGGFFLDDALTTLAERLKEAGFVTGAFVGAWVLESKWGLAQGFDHYSDRFELSQYKVLSLGTVQKRGDEVMDDALAWLETVRERRFFAWIHLYDPHTPYDPPEPYRGRYPGQPYLGEVAYTDAVVGRLTDWLRRRDLFSRTVLVVTADHGESLGEHGEATHAYFIYDTTMAVPLVIRTPWGDRGRVAGQVSSVDILPTLLDLLGLAPEEGIDGRSLVRAVLDPATDPGHLAYAETYFPRYHFGWQHLRGLRNGTYKYVDAPQPELYDLKADPAETRNIYKGYSARAEELRVALDELSGSGGQTAPERGSLDPDTLQRLAALGYVGSITDVDPQAVLPDPKTKVDLFARMNAAKNAAQSDRLDEAIATMREVVAQDPGIVDAHLTLGNWLSRARRHDDAVEAFKRVLSLKADHELALLNLAHLYRAQGRATAAIEGYRSVLDLDPRNPQAWYQLATIYLDLGRIGDAEATFRQALQNNPRMGASLNGLGVIAHSRGRRDEAETLIRKALELEPRLRTGAFNLARILEERGDLPGAESLYRQELATFPDNGKARFNLAQLARARGGGGVYLAELQACVEQAQFGPCHFYLAREELRAGRLEAAAELALRGLAVDSASEVAPLGYYVLADVYSRRGESSKAETEVAKARRLEAALRRHPSPKI